MTIEVEKPRIKNISFDAGMMNAKGDGTRCE